MTDSDFCSYTNPSRATIPLIRPHQCDSEGGRIRGVLLYPISAVRNSVLPGAPAKRPAELEDDSYVIKLPQQAIKTSAMTNF